MHVAKEYLAISLLSLQADVSREAMGTGFARSLPNFLEDE